MDVHELLDRLDALGVTLSADAGELVVRPASVLTDELRAGLKEHRDDLVDALMPPPPPWWAELWPDSRELKGST